MNEELLFLQNNEVWMEVMQLNTASKDTIIFKRQDGIKISGHYAKINGNTLMFYRKDKSLYIYIGNKEICLDENVNLLYERMGANITFSIYRDNDALFSITYPSFRNDPINMEDFDFNSEKEEDYDIFLFIYNVFNNPERKCIIYT